ncbi:diguanylate cyclase [Alteromonas sp. 5E99-2]|uniref:sensor domain-containing diguanylate cyclase n=1 Tax=Alteromonas sp. 5E99-2 TaxID=2817683 RepID=UPI001A995340|nr:diguanylate cyclase [Alteromonas sp. 5E99-2]MBO1254828.1 diguanylate cyclase [Alteromonas sp. 5E99-2]
MNDCLNFLISSDNKEDTLYRVLNTLPQAIFWKDKNSIYLGCNLYFAKVAGVSSPRDIVGKTDYDMPWNKEQADLFIEFDQRVIKNDQAELHIIESLIKANGEHVWLETNKLPLYDDSGNVSGVIGTFIEVTDRINAKLELEALNKELEQRVIQRTKELKEANIALEKLALLDELTQIPNRRAFREYFDKIWHSHYKDKSVFSLMLIDIDYFKRFNDAVGHVLGDEVLVKVARHLDTVLSNKRTDFVARFGGEEFAVLLPNTDVKGAQHVADALLKSVAKECIQHPDSPINPYITVSIGISVIDPVESKNDDNSLDKVDKALYQAKKNGRNRYQLSE